MSRRSLAAFVLLTAAMAGPAAAQQPVLPSVPQTLSLQDALDLAAQNNPTFRQAQNDRGPAGWGVRNAYASLFLPSFNASGTLSYQGSGAQRFLTAEFEQGSPTLGSSYSLGLSWRFSGATLAQPGVATSELRAVHAAIDGARTTLESLVRQQYLAVLQAQEEVGLAQVQLQRNEEFLRLAQARFQVGQATLLDVRQAEVAKGQSEVGLLQARQAVIVEQLRLFQQMGIAAPEDPTVVTLTDTFPVVEPTWSLSQLLAEADADNPDVATLRASAAAARSRESAARSEWLPTLSFSAGWSGFTQELTNDQFLLNNARRSAQADFDQCSFSNASWLNANETPLDCNILLLTPTREQAILDDNNAFPFSFTRQPFGAQLTISLPIFTQFGRPQRVSQASAAADDAREMVEARRLQVRTDVSQAFYALQTAYQTIGIQVTNRSAAREQLRLASERYRVGSGTFFELLDAQLAAQRAEADYINAVYGYHRSVASLEAAVGRPLR